MILVHLIHLPAYSQFSMNQFIHQFITVIFIYISFKLNHAFSFTSELNNVKQDANNDTVSIYQVSSVELVTDKKLEAFNNTSLDCCTCRTNSYRKVT